MEETLNYLEALVDMLQNSGEQFYHEIEMLKEKNFTLEQKNLELQEQKNKSDAKWENFAETYQELQEKLNACHEAKQQLEVRKTELQEFEESLLEREAEVEKIKEDAAAVPRLQDKIKELEAGIIKLKEEKAQAEQQKKITETALNSKTSELTEWKEKHKELVSKYNDIVKKYNDLLRENQKQKNRNDLVKENDKLKKEIEKLKKTKKSELGEEITRLNDEISRLKIEKQDADSKHREEIQTFKKKCEELERKASSPVSSITPKAISESVSNPRNDNLSGNIDMPVYDGKPRTKTQKELEQEEADKEAMGLLKKLTPQKEGELPLETDDDEGTQSM